MSTDLPGISPSRPRAIVGAMRSLARGVLIAVCVCLACTAILGGRYLLFEYRHGDRQMVLRLLDHLSPGTGFAEKEDNHG